MRKHANYLKKKKVQVVGLLLSADTSSLWQCKSITCLLTNSLNVSASKQRVVSIFCVELPTILWEFLQQSISRSAGDTIHHLKLHTRTTNNSPWKRSCDHFVVSIFIDDANWICMTVTSLQIDTRDFEHHFLIREINVDTFMWNEGNYLQLKWLKSG